MYPGLNQQTTFFEDVPVSVTMEEEAKNLPQDGKTDPEESAARILQVTIGAAKVETAAASIESAPDDAYVLQPPRSVEATSEVSVESQIQRDFDGLTDIERQHVHFDMRGQQVFQEDPSTPQMMKDISKTIDSPISDSELESLGRELHLLLDNPEEQKANRFYQTIGKTLSASGSDFYANSTNFRSKLLRAEHRDIPKAAKRTADYLSLLCELFGEDLLSRPIHLSDLNASERQLQRKGYQQLFRFRDQSQHLHEKQEQTQEQQQPSQLQDLVTGAGRRIAGSFDLCRCVSSTEPEVDDETAKTRVLLYLMQVASDDEETQNQGIVFIFMLALRAVTGAPQVATVSAPPTTSSTTLPEGSQPASATSNSSLPRSESDNIFANDSNSDSDNHSDEQILAQLQFSPHESTHKHNHTKSRVKVLSKIFRCGPLRVSAIHVCSPSRPELQQIKLDFVKTLSRHERVRTRFHDGTSMECSLSLNKVGIPTDRLPLKYDGTIKTEDHLQWIAIQEAKESSAKHKRAFDIVECPMNMDILSGRGQLVRSHPGNVSFRKDFIRARSGRYDMASNREEKNAIADEILEDISTLKRKFLKQHQGAGYWTELDKKTAKEKVMMAFREFRKSQRNQQQQQQIRKARSSQAQPHQPSPARSQQRPSLPMSHALPHSPMAQPAGQQLRSPSIPPVAEAAGQQHQPPPPQGEPHPGGIHYQLYPPPPPGSVPGLAPGEVYHPGLVPPPPYYAHPSIPPPPPHMLYGHPPPPIPPHLLPPQHHYAPPPAHEDPANSSNAATAAAAASGSETAAAVPPMGYAGPPGAVPAHPHLAYHPVHPYPPHRPNYYDPAGGSAPGGDGERQYKRHKGM